MFLDQPFRGFGQIAGKRDPVEMSDHQGAVGFQQARCLGRRRRAVKPMPALAGRHHIEGMIGEAGFLGAGDNVIGGGDARLAIEPFGLFDQRIRRIEAGYFAAGPREAAPESAGAEIEQALARLADTEDRQAII